MKTITSRMALAAVALTAALAAGGCVRAPWLGGEEAATPEEAFALAIEKAHGAKAWRTHQALAAGLFVGFGGGTIIEGPVVFDTPLGRSRMAMPGGATVIFDGTDAWVTPATAEAPMARFHVLTWPYFVAAPFKLRDPGARLELLEPQTVRGVTYDRARMTFEPGVGDAPDDWYILYREPETHRLKAMAYIVTYGGKSPERAAEDPHAVVYDDFREIDGVTVSTRWRIYDWSAEEAWHGDPLGEMTVEKPRFVMPAPNTFVAPAGAKQAPLP
jgi:hypothetical protein